MTRSFKAKIMEISKYILYSNKKLFATQSTHSIEMLSTSVYSGDQCVESEQHLSQT